MLELLHGSKLDRGSSASVSGVKRKHGVKCSPRAEHCLLPVFSNGCACSSPHSHGASRIVRNEMGLSTPYGRAGIFLRLTPDKGPAQGFSGAPGCRNPCNSYRTCKNYVGGTLGGGEAFPFYRALPRARAGEPGRAVRAMRARFGAEARERRTPAHPGARRPVSAPLSGRDSSVPHRLPLPNDGSPRVVAFRAPAACGDRVAFPAPPHRSTRVRLSSSSDSFSLHAVSVQAESKAEHQSFLLSGQGDIAVTAARGSRVTPEKSTMRTQWHTR